MIDPDSFRRLVVRPTLEALGLHSPAAESLLLGTASQAGILREVIFDGVLTLTHSANLDLPGAANITTATGDRAIVRADTTTKTVVTHHQPAAILAFMFATRSSRVPSLLPSR